MITTLDSQNLFDEQGLAIELGSVSRDSVERVTAGLDGVLSIDLGQRSRKIQQKGVLRAKSRWQMEEKVSAISAFIDGDTHTLVTSDGLEFDNLRMDVFKVTAKRPDGSGLCCDYQIIYTQLKV